VACRALEVCESWFYKHKDRPPTVAEERRTTLDAAVSEVFVAWNGEYGSPRIHAELIERPEWVTLSVNTVAESMVRQGLQAKKRPVRRSLTRPDPKAPKFENLLKRDFCPSGPNLSWVGDITEVVCWDGKFYLATVIDLWSRRLIGFAIGEHCKASLVVDALKMAIATRGGDVAGVIMHTDRGSQYTANVFIELCQRHKITQSMSRSGSCLDNAAAESFFASLKTELVYRIAMRSKTFGRERVVAWLDRYNQHRRHSHCGLRAPIVYEQQNWPDQREVA
jgi:transposase InsO family protein